MVKKVVEEKEVVGIEKKDGLVELNCNDISVNKGELAEYINKETRNGVELAEWNLGILRACGEFASKGVVKGKRRRIKLVRYQGLELSMKDKREAMDWLTNRGWGKPVQAVASMVEIKETKSIEIIQKEVIQMLRKVEIPSDILGKE